MFQLNLTDYDRRVYETELRGFLPDNLIDIHTHIWKNTFRPQGEPNGGSTWIDLVADEQTAEDLTGGFRALFPGQGVTPLVFGGCSHDVGQCNAYVRESAQAYGFPTLFRTTYDMPPDFLESEVRQGGFLGLKPYLSNCPPYIPEKEIRIFDFLPHEHLEAADRNGWIVMLHIPRAARLRDALNIAQLMEIERKYPNVRLVVAHIGRAYSKEDIGDAFEVLRNTRHMLFDFTANVCDDAIKACIRAVGTKRLLFGSDLPIAIMRMYRVVEGGVYRNVVPRGLYGDVSGDPHMRQTDETDITLMIYEELRALKRCAFDLKLSDGDIEDILYRNARDLLAGAGYTAGAAGLPATR